MTTAEALRYGTCSQGISQFYLHTHTFIRNRNEPYLPLPSPPQLVLIYRPRRDGRLSRPWCEVAQAEIRTRNLPIANPALYHTVTSAPVVRRSQKFRPAADRLPGTRDGQYSISWRWSLPLPINPVWRGSMHAISSYRGNRLTQQIPTNKQTGPITIHCAAASAQCNKADG